MVRMYVRHPVEEYEAWRRAYDGFNDERAAMGVKAHAVYQAIDDANDVTVWHDFDSAEDAQGFANSDRLREVMDGAGVAAPPTIWFTTEAGGAAGPGRRHDDP